MGMNVTYKHSWHSGRLWVHLNSLGERREAGDLFSINTTSSAQDTFSFGIVVVFQDHPSTRILRVV